MLTAVIALPAAPSGQALANDPPKGGISPQGVTALSGASIGSLGPLTVTISPDLNCAVDKVGDTYGEFYGNTACATLVAADGTLYGPQTIPAGGGASPRTAFTPVSQTMAGGQSSTITTVVDAGSLRITEVDWYREGDNFYKTDVTIRNNGSGDADIRLYRAADCYLQDSDWGFGRLVPGQYVACVSAVTAPDGSVVQGSWAEEWVPVSTGAYSFEGYYDDLWQAIGRKEDFRDDASNLGTYMDNSAGLSWRFTLPAGSERTHTNLIRITDTLDCGSQRLDHQTTTAGGVVVEYDPRFLWPEKDPDHLARAAELAEAVRARAADSLAEYGRYGFPVARLPNPVVIKLTCDLPVPSGVPGFTGSSGEIDLRADFMKSEMAAYIGAPPEIRWSPSGTGWANLIDHELVHTFQIADVPAAILAVRIFLGDHANIEGTATAAEDVLPASDDSQGTAYQAFLDMARRWMASPGQIDAVPDDGESGYKVAAFLEYLGERFGDQTQADLEQRVAAFLRAVYTDQGAAGIEAAIGNVETAAGALRDFLLTGYLRQAGNSSSLPQGFRILDEIRAHGQTSGSASGIPSWGREAKIETASTVAPGAPATIVPDQLAMYAGRVYTVPLAAGLQAVRVKITDHGTSGTGLELGFATSTGYTAPGTGAVSFDPGLRWHGPAHNEQQDYDVSVAGSDTLVVAVANGTGTPDFTITVTACAPGITIDTVPSVSVQDEAGGILAFARPTLDGAAAHGLTALSFNATIGGALATVTSAFELGSTGVYQVFVRPASPLAAGTYTLQLGFGSASAQASLVVTSGGGTLAPAAAGQAGAIRTRLTLGGAGTGGTPIEIGWIQTDGGYGLANASVVATVTSPSGATRVVPLTDRGSAIDSGAGDGAYGAFAYGDNAAGTYQVRVDATGTDRSGAPFTLTLSDSITLAPMVDADGDGVADSLAAQFGPGAADPDRDGATTAAELAAGSDPYTADTDGGGEADATEIAAGRDPLAPGDDLAVPRVGVVADPLDGRLVQLTAAAFDAATPVHVYRVGPDGGVADLGVHAGAGEQWNDGPLPAGAYSYYAVAEPANGAVGAPQVGGPVLAADDAVAPAVGFYVNDNDYATRLPSVTITFVNLTKAVTEMRVAESEAALAAAPWVPYRTQTAFGLSTGDGVHQLVAQVRDASGLESAVAHGFIVLDTAPPSSSAGALPASTAGPSVDVPFTAADGAGAGVAAVELWARYRATSTGAWGDWAIATTAVASPIAYGFPYGDGYYEFYTVAIDAAGNREVAPAAADAATARDSAAPASAALALPPTSSAPAISVPFTASDALSGVASVELWVRSRPSGSSPWGAWASEASGSSSPLIYRFAHGQGDYEFYTLAVDSAGNRESPPPQADAATSYVSQPVEQQLTRTFAFATGLDGWTGSGTDCTSGFTSADGVPAGSLSTTVAGKGKSATCLWRSPLGTWEDWGVPAGATVLSAHLESAATRVAACTKCQAGSITGYRLETGSGQALATLWAGRTLPTAAEAWQTAPAQPDQAIPQGWQGSSSQVRLALSAVLQTQGSGTPSFTLRQDAIVLVVTYQVATPPPDFVVTLTAVGPVCPPGQICATGLDTVDLTGTGTAWGSGPVAVQWRLYGVRADGSRTLVQGFTSATPVDGAFDGPVEDFTIANSSFDVGYTWYDVEVQATAAGLSTTRTTSVGINRCGLATC